MSPLPVPPSSVSRLPCVSFCEVEESATFFHYFECTTANNYSSFDESDDDSDDNSVVDEIQFTRTESPIAIHHQRAYWSCQRGHFRHQGEYKPPKAYAVSDEGSNSNSNTDEDGTGSWLNSLSEDELVTKASSSLGTTSTTSTTTSKVQDILRRSQERARERQRKDCQRRNQRGGSRLRRHTNNDANRGKRLDANGSRSQMKTELQRQNEQTPSPSPLPTKKHIQTRKEKQTQAGTLKKKGTRDPEDPSSPSPRSKPSCPSSPTSNKENYSSGARRSHGKNRFFRVVRHPTLLFKKTRTTDSGSTESSSNSTAMTSVTDGDQSQNSVHDYFAPPTFHEPNAQQNSKHLVSILRRDSYADDITNASSCRQHPHPRDVNVNDPAAAIAACGVRFAEGTKFEAPDHVYQPPRRLAKRCVHPRKQRLPTTRRYKNLSIDDIYALDQSFYEFR